MGSITLEKTEYPEFRHGKIESRVELGEQLIGRTPVLPQNISPEDIVIQYSFGNTTPKPKSWAVGLVAIGEYLMIMKKATIVDSQGRVIICGTRPFDSTRYLFVPMRSVIDVLSAQTFQLLDWMYRETVPVQGAIDNNLTFPVVLPLEHQPSEQTQSELASVLWRSLQIEAVDGKPLAILAVEALLSGKRIFINMRESSTDFWKALLLLLPAACRSEVAVATGTLDESFCQWAHLILKAGLPSPYSDFPEDLLHLNTTTAEISGKDSAEVKQFEYTSILKDVVASFATEADSIDSMTRLLQVLDDAKDAELSLLSLKQSTLQPRLVSKLAELLPLEQGQALCSKHLAHLKTQEWKKLIQEANLADGGINLVWPQLQRRAIAEPQTLVPLMHRLWSRFEVKRRAAFLDSLTFQKCPGFVEVWISTGLLQPSDFTSVQPEVASAWLRLCQKVIVAKSQRDSSAALQTAEVFAKSKLFGDRDLIWLFDAVLAVDDENLFYTVFNQQIACRIASAGSLESSYLYHRFEKYAGKHFLKLLALDRQETLPLLPDIAASTRMSLEQQDIFYVNFLRTLESTFEQAKTLLDSLIEDKLFLQSNERLSSTGLTQTRHWFQTQKPELVGPLTELCQGNPDWNSLMCLARVLHDSPQSAIIYADRLVDRYSLVHVRVEVISDWLNLIIRGEAKRSKLMSSSLTWDSLSSKELSSLAINIDQALVIPLIRVLVDSQRFGLIAGTLLQRLEQDRSSIYNENSSVLEVVLAPAVTEHYSEADWLAIARITWLHGLWNYPFQKPQKLSTGSLSRLCTYAKEAAQSYQEPQQIENLLTDCDAWHLGLSDKREILLDYLPKPCRIPLIARLIYPPSNPELDLSDRFQRQLIESLVNKALQTSDDIAQYKRFLGDFAQRITNSNQDNWLAEPTSSPNRDLYVEAFRPVVQRQVETLSRTSNLPISIIRKLAQPIID